jgi:hypothetical protein
MQSDPSGLRASDTSLSAASAFGPLPDEQEECEKAYRAFQSAYPYLLWASYREGWLAGRASVTDARALPAEADRVIKAATLANFCPSAGGYRDGQSVEGCYEELTDALNAFYGSDVEAPLDEWITEQELDVMLGIAAPLGIASTSDESSEQPIKT